MAKIWAGPGKKVPVAPNPLKLIGSVAPEDKHENDVVTLWYHNKQLVSGADDGKIKVWTENLEPITSWQAHPVNVYSVAVLDDTLYSCSNDGTVKAWQFGTWEFKKNLLENQTDEIIKLYTNEGKLFAGNTQGEIFVFQNDEQVATYFLHEDIMDFIVQGPLVFNARNVDISVTEMMGGPRFNYMSRGAMIGRFPIRLIGDKVCFLSRCAKCIYVHASSKDDKFRRIAEIKAHDMTITGMCHLPGKEHIMLSGGFDRVVKAWDLNTKKKLAQLDVGVCINEIQPGPPGQVYITGSDGFIYVLTVLGFTYPSVYQGWQTLVGAFILLYLRPSLFMSNEENNRLTCLNFFKILPNLLVYVGSIVSGSKALSTIPVPLFICAQNTSAVCVLLCTLKHVNLFDFIVSVTALISSLFLFLYIEIVMPFGYHPWPIFFILTTSIVELTTPSYESNSKEISKLYYRNIFSFIILMPSSLYLGEAFSALHFKYLDQVGFYGCCCISGVSGIFLQLYSVRLLKKKQFNNNNVFARLVTLALSLLFFDFSVITIPLWLLILVQCVSTVIFTYSSHSSENKPSQECLI